MPIAMNAVWPLKPIAVNAIPVARKEIPEPCWQLMRICCLRDRVSSTLDRDDTEVTNRLSSDLYMA